MRSTAPPLFFGAYNARQLNAEEVANRFVPSRRFWQLVTVGHTLIIGPRGSGKTHLLKMLQPKALAAWRHPDAERARQTVPYHGVFVAADVNWRAQIDERALGLPCGLQNAYRRGVFISHFREALVTCMLQMTRDRPRSNDSGYLRYSLDPTAEAEVSLHLARTWNLRPALPSFLGLRQAIVDLTGRLSLGKEYSPGRLDRLLRKIQPDVVSTARQAVEAFNSAVGCPDARWALCFDELEIVPEAIQEELFQSLRSTDQRLLFKLAISPFNRFAALLNQVQSAGTGSDFDVIPLWLTDTRETLGFCSELWSKQVNSGATGIVDPVAVLGHSPFHATAESDRSGGTRYLPHGSWSQAFTSLARKDPSFANFLHEKAISPGALRHVSPGLMDSVVRKGAPLVGFLNEYLTQRRSSRYGSRPGRRPLTSPPERVFGGWEALCIATEGNPRWFGGVINRLLLRWNESGRRLTKAQQVRELASAAHKFHDWISAAPVPETAVSGPLGTGIRGLVDRLGSEFSRRLLGGEFKLDPVLAFYVDANVTQDVHDVLIAALNVGAIVLLDDREVHYTLSDLSGKKFRLVHLLAPIYGLPLRTGKARALSSLLHSTEKPSRSAAPREPRRPTDDMTAIQEELFK